MIGGIEHYEKILRGEITRTKETITRWGALSEFSDGSTSYLGMVSYETFMKLLDDPEYLEKKWKNEEREK
jgi:hypothetical protein